MILFFYPPQSEAIHPKIRESVRNLLGEAAELQSRENVPSGWGCFVWKTEKNLKREELVALRSELSSLKIDIIQVSRYLQSSSLFCFDMDSTLIREEVIDELARFAGVYDQVAEVTKEAMEGNLNFIEALEKRCTYLKDLPVTVFDDLYPKLRPNHGVPDLITGLKKNGTKIAVFSGGFSDILEKFRTEYGIDEVRANYLDRQNGKLTGRVVGRVVDKNVKKDSLIELGSVFSIPFENIVAVGDGANDQLMLDAAGIGIGFHAKEGLKSQIRNWVDFAPMDVLLYLFEN